MSFTAARLCAALLLAGLSWYVSDLIRPLMPDSTIFGWFNHVNAALGALVGWKVIGGKAGRGLLPAMSTGVTAVFVLVFSGLFLQSVNEMLRLSMRRIYGDPLRAMEDIFRIGAEFGVVLLSPTVALPLLIGGVVVAVITELVSTKWN